MNSPTLPSSCTPELCALYSRRAGEDPVGTASGHSRTLLVELPLPWPRNLLEDTPRLPGLGQVLRSAQQQGTPVRPLALVPQGDLPAGLTRALLYRQPTGAWARMPGREFIVPTALVARLAEAYAHDDEDAFAAHEQDMTGRRDLLVCTHGSVDAACGKLGYPLYRELRDHLAPELGGSLRAWRSSHFGGHRFAPTLLDFPSGRAWAHVDAPALRQIARQDGDVRRLHAHQRGWSGADYWGQHAERAVFEHIGWDWLTWRRRTETLDAPRAADPATTPDPAAAARVAVHYVRPDASRGHYEVTLEYAGCTDTLPSTGAEPQRVNHYRPGELRHAGDLPA